MASSKKNKLGKLKQAAREHLDETIGPGTPGPERPQSDMRDFMESMPGKDPQKAKDPGKKKDPPDDPAPVADANKSSADSTAGSTPESLVKSSGAGFPEAAPEKRGAAVPPEETLVEVDSDHNKAGGADQAGATEQRSDQNEAGREQQAGHLAGATGRSESPPEIELPNGGQASAYAGKAAGRPERPRSMPKTRDSIYNVSSDIRLEDYTEGNGGSGGGGRMGTIAKIGGVIVLLALLGWGGQQLMLWIDAPSYRVTVANELIDETNAASMAESPALVLSSSAPIHIRFDWEEGDLATDFLRIEILQAAGGQVEAAQERRPPLTANYVYFMGPLDPGSYRIRVLDREKSLLVERDFRVN
ncbi:MAG: hypothetical protein NXI24_21790 [bacterium]|nr:hypothetical protein [bacterium]